MGGAYGFEDRGAERVDVDGLQVIVTSRASCRRAEVAMITIPEMRACSIPASINFSHGGIGAGRECEGSDRGIETTLWPIPQ